MKTKVVLISGKQGSGKTELAKALTETLRRYSDTLPLNEIFAGALYKMHDLCWGVLEASGYKRSAKKDGRLLQLLGTEWGRGTIDQDIWVNILKNSIENGAKITMEMAPDYKRVVFIVSDCRFKNEFHAFPDAITVRLDADREVRKARCEAWRDTDNHLSETDLDIYSIAGKFRFNFRTDDFRNTPQHMAELITHEILNS